MPTRTSTDSSSHALDDAASLHRALEDLKRARLGVLRAVDQLHVEARVGLIAAEALHRLFEREAREGRRQVDVEALLKRMHDRPLDQL